MQEGETVPGQEQPDRQGRVDRLKEKLAKALRNPTPRKSIAGQQKRRREVLEILREIRERAA